MRSTSLLLALLLPLTASAQPTPHPAKAHTQAPHAALPTIEVLSPQWTAIRFEPQFPHGRHTQNPLTNDGAPIEGATPTLYRIPLPDFLADSHPDRILFVGEIEGNATLKAEATEASAATCPAEACARLRPGLSAHATLLAAAFHSAVPADAPIPAAEIALAFSSTGKAYLHGAGGGTQHRDPILLVHSADRLRQPIGWHTAEQAGIPMPQITPLFDQFLRDTSICLAADGNYYMTGTTGGPEMMIVTSDLSVWRSPDLRHWFPVKQTPRASTVVWNIDRDGTWEKAITMRDGEPFRPLWAPEIHYFNNTFWIPFSVPRVGLTILKSTTGKAEGPYEVAIQPDKPLVVAIDGSLFQDDDGTVYALYGGGQIAKMKPDMTGIAEPFHHLVSAASGREIGFEGVFLFKDKGRYYLSAADFVQGEYHVYTASAANINGPYTERYLSAPHAGHNNFFRDKKGQLWTTYFGNDRHTPIHAQPAVFPMLQDAKGRWRPDPKFAWPPEKAVTTQETGAIGPSDGSPQQVGVMPSNR